MIRVLNLPHPGVWELSFLVVSSDMEENQRHLPSPGGNGGLVSDIHKPAGGTEFSISDLQTDIEHEKSFAVGLQR